VSGEAVKEKKKTKVAWGISGSGDKLAETVDVMIRVKKQYANEVDIRVYLSKAGEQVIRWYKLNEKLNESFDKLLIEANSNSPFLAGDLQTGKFAFLLIAPATSNTVAKIANGITDSLLTNSAIMALKGFTSVYIMPVDFREGTIMTKLPDGKDWKVRVRKEDAENAQKLKTMKGITVLEKPEEILEVFRNHFPKGRVL
jgi:archaeoflavoprotein AfpA